MSRAVLHPKKRPAFAEDAKTMTDAELAVKYKIRERNATNWRIKLVGKKSDLTDAEVQESLERVKEKLDAETSKG